MNEEEFICPFVYMKRGRHAWQKRLREHRRIIRPSPRIGLNYDRTTAELLTFAGLQHVGVTATLARRTLASRQKKCDSTEDDCDDSFQFFTSRLLLGERDSADAPGEDIAAHDAAGGIATKNNCSVVGSLEFIADGWLDNRWLLPFVGQGQLSVLHS